MTNSYTTQESDRIPIIIIIIIIIIINDNNK